MAKASAMKSRSRPSAKHVVRREPDRSKFIELAQQAIGRVGRTSDDLRRLVEPIEQLNARYRQPYEPDERLVEYAREYSRVHLEASRRIGQTLSRRFDRPE